MPVVAVSHPNSAAMGITAMLMFTRSMLHSIKATKHSATMVHRRFQRLTLVTTCRA